MRAGTGYDVHRFAENRKLILCGVEIPYEKGLLGHSDADVLVHAIMDALLGAAALGDIGKHFPDTDPEYKGADSMKLMCFKWGQGHPLFQISELGPLCTSLLCAQDPLFISIYPSSHGPATSEPPAGLSCRRNHTLLYVCTQSM